MSFPESRISSRSLYLTLGLAIAAALTVALRDVLLVVMAGVILGVVFSFPVRWLSHIIPRGLAVLVTLLFGAGILGGVGYLAYQPLSDQVTELKQHAPQAIEKAKRWVQHAEQKSSTLTGGATNPAQNSNPQQSPQNTAPASNPAGGASISSAAPAAAAVASKGTQIISGVVELLAGILIVVVLAAFFSHEPDSYRDGVKKLVPREGESAYDLLWDRLRIGLRHWVGGILISMSIMGSLCAIGLWVAGIQAWPLLGLLTFFGTFVPYLGAISSAVPGLLLALAQSGGKLLAAAGVYLGVHIVEGYIVQPLVMERAVVIRPATLLIWQLVMGTLCGIMGIVVATPLLVVVQITVETLYVERYLCKPAEGAGEAKRAA